MLSNRTSHASSILACSSVLGLAGVAGFVCWRMCRERRFALNRESSAYESLVGKTPCVLLPNLSKLVGREIYVKMESWNPGGTGKDRAAKRMIEAAEASGLLPGANHDVRHTELALQLDLNGTVSPNNSSDDDTTIRRAMLRSVTGGLIVEGTSGSTGIALAAMAVSRGHACIVILPDDQASEKRILLEVLGAIVYVVPTAAIASPQHYVNVANRLASRAVELGIRAVFINQFENLANFQVHYETTGPEIWAQCHPDAFVMSAGTGGTIGGAAKFLKSKNGRCRVVLVDPVGSVLYSKVKHGVAFTSHQKERVLLRHRYDSIAEGIGLDRVTANVVQALPYIDSAMVVQDQEAVDMAHFILKSEGLLIGSSSAMNLVGAVRTATQLPFGSSRVCTVVCDSGQRHVTRFWNREFILSRGLQWPRDNPDWTHTFINKLQKDTTK